MERTIRNIVISGMVALLAACGGSDDSDSNEQLPIGIYQGTWDSGQSNGTLYALSLNNETQALSSENVPMNIQFSVSGDAVTGQGKYYSSRYDYMGTVSAVGTLSGTSLTAEVTRDTGTIDNVKLTRDDASSDTGASFGQIAGVYQSEDQSADITFSDIGGITGSDGDNCVYSGGVEIPDAAVNVYNVNLTLTECTTSKNNGIYTGLATVDDSDSEPDYKVRILYGNDSRLTKLDLL